VPLSHARDGAAEEVTGGGAAAGDDATDGGSSDSSPARPECEFEFDGGGTAFFSRHNRTLQPNIVVRPPPGTAIVFCGGMRHAGEPVVEGTREYPPTQSNNPASSVLRLLT
jgi:hypothetical protein